MHQIRKATRRDKKQFILLILFAIALSLNCFAQPYPDDNIYVTEKFCSMDYNIQDIAFAADGSIYGVGEIDYDHAPNTYQDAIIMKMDANFDTLWVKQIGGSWIDRFKRIEKLAEDRYLIMGETGSTDGDVDSLYPLGAFPHPWLLVVDGEGDILHQTVYGVCRSNVRINDLAVNQYGQIYVSGGYPGTSLGDFAGRGKHSLFEVNPWVAMLDTQLNKKWLNTYDCGFGDAYTLDTDTAGNVVVGMSVRRDDTAFYYSPSKGSTDIHIFSIDTAGHDLSKRRIGGSQSDLVTELIIDEQNQMYLAVMGCRNDGDFYIDTVGRLYTFQHILKYQSYLPSSPMLWNCIYGSFDTTYVSSTFTVDNPKMILTPQKDIFLSLSFFGADSNYFGMGIYPDSMGYPRGRDMWYLHIDSTGHWDSKRRWGYGGEFSETQQSLFADAGFKQNPYTQEVFNMVRTTNSDRILNSFACDSTRTDNIYKMVQLERWPQSISYRTDTELDWEVYPNPAKAEIHIRFGTPQEGTLKILSVDGAVHKVLHLDRQRDIYLDTHRLPAGNYILQYNGHNTSQSKKITIINP